MVEFTSNSKTSLANEYKSTKSGRVAMRLPCCHFVFCGHFPPEVTTDMWFMMVAGLCVETRSLEMNCKLQNWMLTLLLRILSWLIRLFRSWKCAVACILKVWWELQKKSPNSETLTGYISVIFLSEIHKWPLIFFLKSSIFFLNTFCGQIRKNYFGLKSL